eukprot:m.119571 g.119571  ORF g.119571 m.119571 type:complete len:111 (-) comp19548_c0_seq4:193-525(-)
MFSKIDCELVRKRCPNYDTDPSGWMNTVRPTVTAYKVVTCEFRWYGLQHRMEVFLQHLQERVYLGFHKQLVSRFHEWAAMSMDDIRQHEHETAQQLDHQRNHHDKRNDLL